jgi:hypothetical protein
MCAQWILEKQRFVVLSSQPCSLSRYFNVNGCSGYRHARCLGHAFVKEMVCQFGRWDSNGSILWYHPTCEGTFVTLHREPTLRYHVEDLYDPMNELVGYDDEFGIFAILENSLALDEETLEDGKCDEVWKMNFDGAQFRSRAGVGIVFTPPEGEVRSFSYRLKFDCTNNIAEYEALFLGLELALDMEIKCLQVICDSNLIVLQVKRQF